MLFHETPEVSSESDNSPNITQPDMSPDGIDVSKKPPSDPKQKKEVAEHSEDDAKHDSKAQENNPDKAHQLPKEDREKDKNTADQLIQELQKVSSELPDTKALLKDPSLIGELLAKGMAGIMSIYGWFADHFSLSHEGYLSDFSPEKDDDYFPKSLHEDQRIKRLIPDKIKNLYGGGQETIEQRLVTVTFLGKDLKVHGLIAPFLKWAVSRITDEGITYQIKDMGGYCFRNIAGTRKLSNHAYGIAIDINPEENPRQPGVHDHADMKCDLPPRFVQIMKECGFFWGGDWRPNPDPMHFEFVRDPWEFVQTVATSMPQSLQQEMKAVV